ncbi:uncharacterized protein LOC128959930 [Oppia nitens]|uniref:uncharacterized protein LOC128959930 n=1 Tax=Oppia nitens TaxID=1686743 RepID=UPI0023DA53E9|nr:uncharacterized protein LOC128959930 [Oppia nitens]
MQNTTILSAIVLMVFTIYLCESAKVMLTITSMDNKSDRKVNCSYELNNQTEHFNSLFVDKDNQVFYSIDNKTSIHPNLTSVSGINKTNIKILSPNVFIINNVNKTTSGKYTCEVRYNNGQKVSKSVDLKVNAGSNNFVSGTLALICAVMLIAVSK